MSLRSFARCESGSNAVEFAFTFPIWAALTLATLQVSAVLMAQSYLETVTENAERLVLTNQVNSMTQAQFATAICNGVSALFTCANIIVQLEPAPATASGMAAALPQFDATGKLLNPTTFSVLPAPAKMMLVVMYKWPVYGGPLGLNLANMGNGSRLLVSTQVFEIEPKSS